MYEVFLDVYSNKINSEYFELHIWDASEGREYRNVSAVGLPESNDARYPGLYEFIDNTVYGSPSVPIVIEAAGELISKIPLTNGWNWCSFNLQIDKSKSINELLGSLNATNGDIVKGIAQYSTYSTYWAGTLSSFEPEQMYMIRTQHKDTLKMSGLAVDPAGTPIEINSGWNWIGYTPLVNISINEALGLFTPSAGDLIKSQYEFCMYDELMGWVGTLDYLQPFCGYKYKHTPEAGDPQTQNLYFPEEGTMLKSTPNESDTEKAELFSGHEFNMPLVAVLDIPASNIKANDRIEVYVGDELRGYIAPEVLPNGKPYFFITAYGDNMGQLLSFRYLDSEGRAWEINEVIPFDLNTVKGDIADPVVFTLTNGEFVGTQETVVATRQVTVYPNPFSDQIMLNADSETMEDMEIRVVNMLGETVVRLQKVSSPRAAITLNLQNLEPGVYFIHLQTGAEQFVKKVTRL